MAVDKFKFVSPGVFLEEIDESGLPTLPTRMGPMIVGRFQKGPSNRPVQVNSFKEFVQIFGSPTPGNAKGDIWRNGELTAPTYAAYAVQAWLRNNSPCTVYRVLGENASNADSSVGTALAGWTTDQTLNIDIGSSGGAYGLFVFPNPDSSAGSAAATAEVTFAGSIANGETITIVSSDGTSVTYTAAAAENTDDGEFKSGDGFDDKATSLKNCIAAGAHAGKITAVAEGPVLQLTQSVAGGKGNRKISEGLNNTTATNFGGGLGPSVTGTLAAIWYIQDGAVVLEGTGREGTSRTFAAGVPIKGDNGVKFTAKIVKDGVTNTNVLKAATFNFDETSDLYIRKVFNTDPTKTNGDLVNTDTTTLEYYWLGETFDSNLKLAENTQLKVTGSTVSDSSDMLGVILGLEGTADGSTIDWQDHKQQATAAQTGWIISQDTRGTTTSNFNPTQHTELLFKFHALDSGAHANRDYKVSVQDIKAPTDKFNKYGTFSIVIRRNSDSDNKPQVLERYSGLTLDPTSTNYLAKAIGDKYYEYNSDNKTIVEHGEYDNLSKILRVEMAPKISDGLAGQKTLIPYGGYGPSVPITFRVLSGSTATSVTDNGGAAISSWVVGSGSANCLPSASIPAAVHGPGKQDLINSRLEFSASLEFPTARLRASSSEGSMVLGSQAYFGYQSVLKGTRRFDATNLDLHRLRVAGHDPTSRTAGSSQYSWVFTLDDVKESPTDSKHAVWVSGSRAANTSFTAVSGSTADHYVLTRGYDKFTVPMFGGFDGFDITEKDPFRNNFLSKGSENETTNYAYYSLKKAVDLVSDEEFAEFDVLTMPGITRNTLNNQILNVCEDRADSLAILDIAGGYEPPHETNTLETARVGNVDTAVSNLKDFAVNSSYGCMFYPFVKIRDNLNDASLYVPPSVVALGTFSSSQRKSAVWFAPAGFTRGGLSEGSAGLPVLGVRQRLTSAERDKLYDANINPIASFPAEGVVIFGQKTLQVTTSALDRINVRRLLIFVKKEISRISSRLLFEQNVQQTWDRFTGEVVPFLEGVKSGLGLTDFRVVLDSTTTTPDLVDRNVLYAKIFLKPARAIEFIALDFIITRSGASFDD